jgi:hypothetical protein
MCTRKILAGAVPLGLMVGAATAIAADRPGLGKPVTEVDLALWDIQRRTRWRRIAFGQRHTCSRRHCLRAEMRVVARKRGLGGA